MILLLAFFASTCPHAEGIVGQVSLSVTVPDDYPTVQSAIDNVAEGSSIIVRNGTYVESIYINKPLKVLGWVGDRPILKSAPGDNVVYIQANYVTFSGFEINGMQNSGAGIKIVQSNHGEISDNLIHGNGYGLYMWDSSNMTLRNNSIWGNSRNLCVWGLFLEHFLHDIDVSNIVEGKPACYWINERDRTVPADAGYVAIINSTSIMVKDLVMSNNLDGVLITYCKFSTIQNVTSVNNDYGIHMLASSENTINQNNSSLCSIGLLLDLSWDNYVTRNLLSGNKQGILLSYSPLKPMRSDENHVMNNNITSNVDGILTEDAANNTFQDNEITSNSRSGVLMSSSTQNLLRGNNLTLNTCGLIFEKSGENTIYNNNFVNNSIHVSIDSSINFWNSTSELGGNYWTGGNHLDEDRNGLADDPYAINRLNTDYFPLAGKFSMHVIAFQQTEYSVLLISNSTSWVVSFAEQEGGMNINVSTTNDSAGFCQLSIPHELVQELWRDDPVILLDNVSTSAVEMWLGDEMLHVYLSYQSQDHNIVIVPEFSASFYLMALLIVSWILLVLATRTGKLCRRHG